uniref:Uncharacterized protein n=1 Tax=Monopterus albus TaxID=43700 RepID=A0A3Q3KEN1_MONAL
SASESSLDFCYRRRNIPLTLDAARSKTRINTGVAFKQYARCSVLCALQWCPNQSCYYFRWPPSPQK